jgi:hypothetical protein
MGSKPKKKVGSKSTYPAWQKSKFGRPTLYKPEYCQMLIDFMGQGYSFEAFAGHIGTCADQIYRWTKDQPDFLKAKKDGFAANRIFWEGKGIKGQNRGKDFNATVWVFNMKNRFNWGDRIAVGPTEDVETDMTAYEFIRPKKKETK